MKYKKKGITATIELDVNEALYLHYIGILKDNGDTIRNRNEGDSNYCQHVIQPWSIWLDYPELDTFDCDIIKRVLRTKKGEDRALDYKKIIHICEEKLRQLKTKKQY